jgi:ABC-type lipoprotein release transport system permease subunit
MITVRLAPKERADMFSVGVTLAYRNIKEAGLRTWLNVAVLAMTFVVIVGFQGLYTGMLAQTSRAMIEDEIAGGQYWHKDYDPYDALSIDNGHGVIPENLFSLIEERRATPILIRQATIYPAGRAQSVQLRGIDPAQTILHIPTRYLHISVASASINGAGRMNGVTGSVSPNNTNGSDRASGAGGSFRVNTADIYELPILIGKRMAKSKNIAIGDYLTIRWRDAHGTFDATEGQVVYIMDTRVPSIDNGIIWVPLQTLQHMTALKNEATLVVVSSEAVGEGTKFPHKEPPIGARSHVVSPETESSGSSQEWPFKSQAFLMRDLTEMIKTKRISSVIIYSILLFLGMLAIFDTQVLSLFRRRKEIGTLIALGMTRMQVIFVFTLEGVIQGAMAIVVALIFGMPLLTYVSKKGIAIPQMVEGYGFALSDKLFPVYSLELVLTTILLMMVVVAAISFLPSSKIAKLQPTEALKGKIS